MIIINREYIHRYRIHYTRKEVKYLDVKRTNYSTTMIVITWNCLPAEIILLHVAIDYLDCLNNLCLNRVVSIHLER